MVKQRTLKHSVSATGVGLHTGKQVDLTLHPAKQDTGVVFRRVDLAERTEIKAKLSNVGDTTLSTTLRKDQVRISTVEHLLSAMIGMGVDNAYVDVSAPEVPIMDGSAGAFVFLIQSAGIEEQEAAKKFIRINHSVQVEEGSKWARLDPYNGFKVTFEIQFDQPVFETCVNRASVDLSTTSFVTEISRSRTFGYAGDVEYLRRNQLALGGSLDNAVIYDDDRIINAEGLRFPNELAKHKILDAFGDLYLLGYTLIGSYTAFKSGHALNNKLLRKLVADPSAWEMVTYNDPQEMPIIFS